MLLFYSYSANKFIINGETAVLAYIYDNLPPIVMDIKFKLCHIVNVCVVCSFRRSGEMVKGQRVRTVFDGIEQHRITWNVTQMEC